MIPIAYKSVVTCGSAVLVKAWITLNGDGGENLQARHEQGDEQLVNLTHKGLMTRIRVQDARVGTRRIR